MIKGQKATEQARINMSLGHKGQKAWNKGTPRTEEEKLKISISNKGKRLGIRQTEEHKRNNSLSKKSGKYFNCIGCGKEFYRSKSRILKGQCKFCSRKCFHNSDINKAVPDSFREYCKTRTGENSPTWKGGLTPLNLKIRNSEEYKQWRLSVFERDKYTCQECGLKSKKGKSLFIEAHHIKSFSNHKNLRFDINNGLTLCKNCHRKTDNYAKNTKYQHE